MRDLINKLSILESQEFNKLSISDHLEKSRDWMGSGEPTIILSIESEFLIGKGNDEDLQFRVDLYYMFDNKSDLFFTEHGIHGEPNSDSVGITIEEDRPITTENQKLIKENLLVAIKQELARIGFSQAAANGVYVDNIVVNKFSNTLFAVLHGIKPLHKEVNAAYQWRLINIGDL